MAPASPQHDLCLRAARMMDELYRNPVTVDLLAAALQSSPRKLQRAYAAAHTTFSEELTRVRLGAAAELLAEQAMGIDVIARLSGYAGAASLADAFRRRYGVTPGQYRRQARAARAVGLAPRIPSCAP